MGEKLGGIVCDNPACTKFIDFANRDGIKNCVIVPKKYKWTYCSVECEKLGRGYRENMESK